jgi:hypothetical protein
MLKKIIIYEKGSDLVYNPSTSQVEALAELVIWKNYSFCKKEGENC